MDSVAGRLSVKEEPLSEEDLRALQKDRQKKDNHNMSELENDLHRKKFPRAHFSITHLSSKPKFYTVQKSDYYLVRSKKHFIGAVA